MAPQLTTCRIRLYNGTQLIDLKDHVPTTPATRKQWATAILTHFRTPTNEPRTRIRPWDLLAHLDGTVGRLQAPPQAEASLDIESVYPIRYRLPPPVPTGGSEQEKLVVRAEKFAMRSLLYEVLTSRKPYEELADDEVQQRFAAGEFPADADALGLPAMLPNDDEDEEEEQASSSQAMVVKNEGLEPLPLNIYHRATTYAHAHPYLTTIQAAGLVLTTTAYCVNPVLTAVGFTAAGPAAGTAAAAWQASLGAVQAGSLFAWCQSAAMGGVAGGGMHAVGLAGRR